MAEDLADASYAGLYETVLNVERGNLADAVRHVIASGLDARVAAYHAANANRGRTAAATDVAVLVQQMIQPSAAGVAFTANPLTGHRDETIVTAVRGLAEQLVAGEAIGEEWVIRNSKAALTRDGEGVLTQVQALAVAALARRVEMEFGSPQDIEWAIDNDGTLFLIQARPMTAIVDAVEWTPPGPGLWARNFRLGEWLPEAMTPLFADWIIPNLESGYLDGMWKSARVRVPFRYATVNGWYYNATPIPSPKTLWRVLIDSGGRAPWFLYNVLARVSRNPVAADRATIHRLEAEWRDDTLPTYRRLVSVADAELDTADTGRIEELVNDVSTIAGSYFWSLAVVGGSAWKMEGALAKFWAEHLAPALISTALGDAGHQVLLRGLSDAAATLPGHAVYSLDWYFPTAGENAAEDTYASPTRAVDHTRTGTLVSERVAAEAACRTALAGNRKLLSKFDGLLAVNQRFASLREEQARYLTLGWPVLRRCAQHLDAQLRQAGVIDDAEDVYFLTLSEIRAAAAGLTTQAKERRGLWGRQRRLPAPLTIGTPPRLIGDPIARAVATARAGHEVPEGAILGHPASIGRATGRVRVINGPADFDSFREGEVLVARATAPAWTPLFSLAAAVVTDGGTLAAHASLIAREYGIPAVVGTGNASVQLTTGQLVTVDGSAGTVTPHN
ncbi:PEP/pyruvate-binding domain-containing protein (plasmid) [Leifsonia sp. P73]|uniref:PEP/pyruvate-binding domain-containing protein n=1 Tax=unclassified Leifsonia TaxID=2663824 RepID=UPI0037048274